MTDLIQYFIVAQMAVKEIDGTTVIMSNVNAAQIAMNTLAQYLNDNNLEITEREKDEKIDNS